jgi:hypothetical protein
MDVNFAPDQTYHRLAMHALREVFQRFSLSLSFSLAIGLAVAASTVTAATAANAPPPAAGAPVYAVLSLVGDKLDVVVPAKNPDNTPAQNVHEFLPIDSAVFDDAAVSAAAAAVKRVVPTAELARLNANAVLYEKQRTLFEENGDAIAMPDAIRAALRQQGATRLVLITKLSDDVFKGFINAEASEGKIEGLGFYFDRHQPVYDPDRNVAAYGSIAPFAWLRVAIIDVGTSRVMARQKITNSTPITTANGVAEGTSPWNALTGEQKMNAIDRLLRREVGRAVTELLKVL